MNSPKGIELSLVMPCLNEEKSVGGCVKKCKQALKKYKIRGEVVVCDNNSSDRSRQIAAKNGARVVIEKKKGYGNACITGLKSGKGKYVLKLDADGSYDPMEIDKFIKYLREGYDVVMGSRLKGKILPGSMPWSHQYIGNPVLTLAARILCDADISDLCCGMKAFSKSALKRLNLKSPGMEFGPETTIKARQIGATLKEVPITYHPDKRARKSNLNQWRDGFRDIKYIFQESKLFRKYA
jgi:glycosyltransferase involved in cell wall biosynthesis